MKIPNDFVDYVSSGDCVVFIGNDLALYNGLPSQRELAAELCGKLGIDQKYDFHKASSLFIADQNNRVSLLNLLRNRLSSHTSTNTNVYELIIKLPVNVFITSAYDHILDEAFIRTQKKVNYIASDSSIPFWSEETAQVIKLFGDPWDPDTTLLTESEVMSFSRIRPDVYKKVNELLLVKMPLFVGFDPDSYEFGFVVNEFLFGLADNRKPGYIVVPNITSLQEKLINQHGIRVINLQVDSDNFITPLLKFLSRVAEISRRSTKIEYVHMESSPVVELSRQVENLLENMNYRVVDRKYLNRRCIELACVSTKTKNPEILFVRCIEGEINSSDVEDLAKKVSASQQGVLISQTRIAPSARLIQKQWPNINLYTYPEFYRQMIDVTDYINSLIKNFESGEIAENYVDLACEKRSYDSGGHEIGRDVYYPIQDYIDLWVGEKGRNHISILGNFGAGKTWFSQFYAYLQAKRYLQDPNLYRIPFIVKLRDYAKAVNIEQLITDLLTRKYRIGLRGGYRAFQQMNKDGKILIIFDGFDEMQRRVDYKVTVENFEKFASVIFPDSKVLLTCRTPYFRTNLQMREVFSSSHDDVYIDLLSRPNFETVHLLDFNYKQIRLALEKRLPDRWESVYQEIQSVYDLPGLARRPALLDMIAQTIPYLHKNEPINQAILYQTYTGQWINKNIQEERTLLNEKQKKYFMREIAWDMYIQEKLTLHYTEIPGRVQEYLGVICPKDIDIFEHDIRTQSFLQRDENGYYMFAHKSFIEYFVADRLSEQFIVGYYDQFTDRVFSFEVRTFMRYLLKDHVSKLINVLDSCLGRTYEEIGYRASNIVSILATIGLSLKQIDFSKTCLRQADFNGVNLSNAKMVGVDAEGANFRGVNFSGADFSGANLKSSLTGENGVIRSVAYHPSGKYVACGGSDLNIRVFDALTGEEVKKIPVFASIRTLLFNTDGGVIISGGADRVVRGWDWEGGHQTFSMEGHQYNIFCLVSDSGGQLVASGDHNSEVRVWHIYSQEQYRKFVPDKKFDQCYMRSLLFTSNGILMGGDSRGYIHCWHLKENKEIFSHEAHKEHVVYGLLLTPDQEKVISCSDDRSVKIWDQRDWKLISAKEGFNDTVLGIAIDKAGKYLATGCRSGEADVWEFEGFRRVVSFSQTAPILSISFSPDGKRLVTGSGDGTTKSWDLESERLAWEFRLPQESFRCKDMIISDVKGWSPEWLRFMIEMGAKTK